MTPDEQRLSSLLAALPHGVQENDLAGIITYSNPAHHRMLGYAEGELVGKTIFALIHTPAERDSLQQYLAYLVAERPTPTPYITISRRQDGTPLHTRIDWNYQYDAGGDLAGFVSAITDISEQLRLQEALQRECDLARHYLDVAQFILVVLDRNGRIVLVNRKACDVLGHEREALLGQEWFGLCIPAEDREQVRRVFQQLMRGEIIAAGYHENTILSAGGARRLIAWHNSVQYDADGNICGSISSGADITEQRAAEQEKTKLYEQIRKAQRMEALGRLTAGIAHDFNNILASILGYADLTLDSLNAMDEPELSRYIGEVIDEGEKARDLITQMLAFARADANQEIALNPVPLLKELVKVLKESMPASIELRFNSEADIPKVLIDPAQLHQAVLNLCQNAREALDNDSGHIDLNISRVTCYQAKCHTCGETFEGDYVEISVADDGQGIEPSLLTRIFEPLFSTKAKGRHGGMGLASVHGIVHDHHGHIMLESIVGYGSTLRLLLAPAYAQQEKTAQARTTAPAGNNARILIVEDEESIARLQSEFLLSKGFKTEVISDTLQALAMLREAPERFDCIVVDQEMPSMNGIQFAREVRRIRAALPLILLTPPNRAADPVLAEIGQRLQKPIGSEQLLALIHNLLKPE